MLGLGPCSHTGWGTREKPALATFLLLLFPHVSLNRDTHINQFLVADNLFFTQCVPKTTLRLSDVVIGDGYGDYMERITTKNEVHRAGEAGHSPWSQT